MKIAFKTYQQKQAQISVPSFRFVLGTIQFDDGCESTSFPIPCTYVLKTCLIGVVFIMFYLCRLKRVSLCSERQKLGLHGLAGSIVFVNDWCVLLLSLTYLYCRSVARRVEYACPPHAACTASFSNSRLLIAVSSNSSQVGGRPKF